MTHRKLNQQVSLKKMQPLVTESKQQSETYSIHHLDDFELDPMLLAETYGSTARPRRQSDSYCSEDNTNYDLERPAKPYWLETANHNGSDVTSTSWTESLIPHEICLFSLFCSMFRCRHCCPDALQLQCETHPPPQTPALNRSCCTGAALRQVPVLSGCLPRVLLDIIESYSFDLVSHSFLTEPLPIQVGTLQCRVIRQAKTSCFELFLELQDQTEYTQLRNKIYSQAPPSSSERKELLHRIFANEHEHPNHVDLKATLVRNAENHFLQNRDVFLLSAYRKTNQFDLDKYLVSTDRGGERTNILGTVTEESDAPAAAGDIRFKMCQIVHTPGQKQKQQQQQKKQPQQQQQQQRPQKQQQHQQQHQQPQQHQQCQQPQQHQQQPQQHQQKQQQPHQQQPRLYQQHRQSHLRETGMIHYEQFFQQQTYGSPVRLKVQTQDCTTTAEEAKTKIECYENTRPYWHDQLSAYVLHFDNHRVRVKSSRNFKLIQSAATTPNAEPINPVYVDTVLQFGRAQEINQFIMDVAYPLSLLQAFEIVLSAMRPKRFV